jgi:hypothetical protein
VAQGVRLLMAIKSLFKFLFVIIMVREPRYKAFKQITEGKHFYDWQWKLLDKIYMNLQNNKK